VFVRNTLISFTEGKMTKAQKRKRKFKSVKKKIDRTRFHSISPLGYVRVNMRYPIDFVLANIGHHYLTLHGHRVKMWSKRYQNFRDHGVTCVKCGIKGVYFRLECQCLHANWEGNAWHFNLYALDENGKEIMMTKDHIIPRSKGGANGINNLQTMCSFCNLKKSDSLE